MAKEGIPYKFEREQSQEAPRLRKRELLFPLAGVENLHIHRAQLEYCQPYMFADLGLSNADNKMNLRD